MSGALWIWALRDVLRRPSEALLTAAALLSLTVVLATPLLLTEAVGHTATRLIEAGPSLVLRRIDGGGWAAMPQSAVAKLRAVRGITEAHTRLWGTVGTQGAGAEAGAEAGTESGGAVTLIGLDERAAEALGVVAPKRGEALGGAGLDLGTLMVLPLSGAPQPLTITQRLPQKSASAALHRAALTHPQTARRLLGLPEGHATDLVVRVLHESEQRAILPDLLAALPFPVRATTQAEAIGLYAARGALRGSLLALGALPALLAVLVLIIGVARDRLGRRAEVALLKAMGWTTTDVLRLHGWRAAWMGGPALVLGLSLAYGLVHWPGITWPGALFYGWTGGAPPLHLDTDGALLVLAEVIALVAVPWFIAALWPALRAATDDAAALTEGA